jgi:hypothetical protein
MKVCLYHHGRAIGEVKQRWSVSPKIYYLKLLRTLEGTIGRWSRLHLLSITPNNLHWARVHIAT